MISKRIKRTNEEKEDFSGGEREGGRWSNHCRWCLIDLFAFDCPLYNQLYGTCLHLPPLFVFLFFCIFVLLYFCIFFIFVFLYFCTFVFLYFFCILNFYIFVFLYFCIFHFFYFLYLGLWFERKIIIIWDCDLMRAAAARNNRVSCLTVEYRAAPPPFGDIIKTNMRWHNKNKHF